MWDMLGLLLIALVGTAFALVAWLRLLVWQRFITLLLHTAVTHAAVLWAVSWMTGFDFWKLMSWGAAIFAACYISYCAYLAHVSVSRLISFAPAYAARLGRTGLIVELVLSFLEYTVYRAVYSQADMAASARRR